MALFGHKTERADDAHRKDDCERKQCLMDNLMNRHVNLQTFILVYRICINKSIGLGRLLAEIHAEPGGHFVIE